MIELIVSNCNKCPFSDYETSLCSFEWFFDRENPNRVLCSTNIPIDCPLKDGETTIKINETL